MILLDTSGLLSALDASEPRHAASVAALRAAGEPRIISPIVLAELDYLLATRVSAAVTRRLSDEVAAGAYELASFDRQYVERAGEILDRYADLALGLADASIVVLAERFGVRDILTLDERHFRVVRGPAESRSVCSRPTRRRRGRPYLSVPSGRRPTRRP